MRMSLFAIATLWAASVPFAHAQQAYTYTLIDVPHADSISPMGINSEGDIVGIYARGSLSLGFVLKANGQFISLDCNGHSQYCEVNGLSDTGIVVGNYGVFMNQIAYVLAKGSYRPFQYEGLSTFFRGISPNGKAIVGYHFVLQGANTGFQITSDGFKNLPDLNGKPVIPGGVNDNGFIAGQDLASAVAGVNVDGFILGPDGKFEVVDYPGATETELNGINNAGVAVGYENSEQSGMGIGGFSYSNGVFSKINYPGTESTATAINSSGVVVGSFQSPNLKVHGFIATPVNK